jgi:hypothetical protein
MSDRTVVRAITDRVSNATCSKPILYKVNPHDHLAGYPPPRTAQLDLETN